jgi:hypothetical protein
MAALLRQRGYQPSSYDVNALVAHIGTNLSQLGGVQLEEVAWACSAYSWPTYHAPVGLLDSLAEEAIRRCDIAEGVKHPDMITQQSNDGHSVCAW